MPSRQLRFCTPGALEKGERESKSTCGQNIDCYAGEKLRYGKEKGKEVKMGWSRKLNTRQLLRGTTREWPSLCYFSILLLSFVRDGCITDGLDVAADQIRVRPQMQTARLSVVRPAGRHSSRVEGHQEPRLSVKHADYLYAWTNHACFCRPSQRG